MTTRQIPWLRVFVEGVVIVGSIVLVLALALDAWWDGGQERAEEQEILRGLRAEFVADTSLYHDQIAFHQDVRAGLAELMRGEAAAELGLERLDLAFYRTLTATPLDPGSGVRDALISSGRLELIRSEELRSRLAEWESLVDGVRDEQELMRAYSYERIIPYLASRDVPLGRAMASMDWPVSHPEPSVTRDAYRTVLADPEFQVHLGVRSGAMARSLGEFNEAFVAARQVLSLIDRELSR